MQPVEVVELLRGAACRVLRSRQVSPASVPERVTVRRSRDLAHGDYASPVALRLAGVAGVPARQLAEWVAAEASGDSRVEKAWAPVRGL